MTPYRHRSNLVLSAEWFRIYFESGVVKILSGDPEWRHFTAMDEYYQNGPLPTWIGWYVQHLPHWFHASTVYATLALELGLVWMLFLPRRWRIVCFFIVTPWQIGVILTANYTFLNYLVLALGVLLLDDRFVLQLLPANLKERVAGTTSGEASLPGAQVEGASIEGWREKLSPKWSALKLAVCSGILIWIFYATTAELIWMFVRAPLPASPVTAIEPFRIANQYGLFDAPYQPRFDWNLWFASLGSWRDYPIVPNTEVRLLSNNKDVLALFAGNPFPQDPPRQIRAVLWQYWFTSMAEKRATGTWWRPQLLGLYAPRLEREPDGTIVVIEWPAVRARQ